MEEIKRKINEKLEELNQWNNDIRIPIPEGFSICYSDRQIPDGIYLTLRVRRGLMYQVLNEVKDGKWQAHPSDGSVVVMYKDVPQQFYNIMQTINDLQGQLPTEDTKAKEEKE